MTDKNQIIGEISKTYIFVSQGAFQVLYETYSGEYYCTSNGGFGQRDTYIEVVPTIVAKNLIKELNKTKNNE